MSRLYETFLEGGFVMFPLLGLSVITFACVLERIWFWLQLMVKEKQVVHEVLKAAKIDLSRAQIIASRSQGLAIGRVLSAPLKLREPSPPSFHHALKASSTKEFTDIRRGSKLLSMVITTAPLLGILGTLIGLYPLFINLKSGEINTSDTNSLVIGLSQTFISSVTGMAIALTALLFSKLFIQIQSQQIEFFNKVASDLELIYLTYWHKPSEPTE
ncbi:MAG: MotA/TolQ/ExbB proton channel family protein [Mastigocoleus sp.]